MFPAFCLYVIKGNYIDVVIPMVDRMVRVKVALANVSIRPDKQIEALAAAKRLCGIDPV